MNEELNRNTLVHGLSRNCGGGVRVFVVEAKVLVVVGGGGGGVWCWGLDGWTMDG